MFKKSLVWLRRDIRLHDHVALSEACRQSETVFLCFVFDQQILKNFKEKKDSRVSFIFQSLKEINAKLLKKNAGVHILFGNPEIEVVNLIKKLDIDSLFFNRDYEPMAKIRDEKVRSCVELLNRKVFTYRDQVIFEEQEILNGKGDPYKVFTPYKNTWLDTLKDHSQDRIIARKVDMSKLFDTGEPNNPSDKTLFKKIGKEFVAPAIIGGETNAKKIITQFKKKIFRYNELRDIPSALGTSSLSPHIRHGTISIRECYRLGLSDDSLGYKTWVSELIWREFYQMILCNFPQVVHQSFRPEYDKIKWPGTNALFQAWKDGKTGYPIIDAAMICFKHTGMMHNRLRMIVASFLCKTLLVDWRWGEEYFAQHLLDFDLASNSGGWQWCSSSGCDAQPYFRIFNPYSQSEKFDPEGVFIRTWLPQLKNLSAREIHRPGKKYISPIVDYEKNRARALKLYQSIKISKN